MIHKSEKGQALVLIVVAIIGLVGMTALTVDGGLAYTDRRNAQNAADAAALAAALANGRGQNFTAAAQAVAATNGYTDNGTTTTVAISYAASPNGACPGNVDGKDITVQITSHRNTYFAPVVGIPEVTNTVSATARSCGTYVAPLFNGNAIVSLTPSGNAFDAHGTPDWIINGGGIFSNSVSCSSVTRGGSASVSAPSITMVAGACGLSGISGIPTATNAAQYSWAAFSSTLPPVPQCTGTAYFANGQWHPQANTEGTRIGSNVAFSGDMNFASGLYCVTNSPGPFHGQITGSGVTFYITSPNFSMKFNGGGNLTAQAPTAGDYKGVLMYLAPQVTNGVIQNTQALDMRGNGNADIIGTIIAPSATVTMFGNSGSAGFHTQIVAYNVDSGGNADINITFNSNENYQAAQPVTLSLIK